MSTVDCKRFVEGGYCNSPNLTQPLHPKLPRVCSVFTNKQNTCSVIEPLDESSQDLMEALNDFTVTPEMVEQMQQSFKELADEDNPEIKYLDKKARDMDELRLHRNLEERIVILEDQIYDLINRPHKCNCQELTKYK